MSYSEESNINKLQVEDNNRKPSENFIPNITDVFIKFQYLISFKRSPVQTITSYIREFEDRVIDLEVRFTFTKRSSMVNKSIGLLVTVYGYICSLFLSIESF